MDQSPPKPAPKDALRQQYVDECFKAGDLQYKIAQYQAELGLVNDKLKNINLEFAAIAEQESKDAEASKAPAAE